MRVYIVGLSGLRGQGWDGWVEGVKPVNTRLYMLRVYDVVLGTMEYMRSYSAPLANAPH